MLAEIILSIILGVAAGTITGLIPGIHINLIGAFLISLSTGILLKINPIFLTIFITAMAIAHTFIDFIPSLFLGCPDTDTELSVLPGHKLLVQGKGYEGILLTAYGGIAAIIILTIVSAPSIFLMKKIYPLLRIILPYLLILVSIILISLEKKKTNAIIVFLLTGILGWAVLNFETLNQSLLPLLTGLFGSSNLILSIKNKTKIPKQEISKPTIKIKKPLLGALIASPLCSFLPGLGSGQAAIIGNLISKQKDKGFLVLIGATNTFVMGFSFLSLYSISKTRTGAAVAVNEILGTLSIQTLILMVLVILVSGIISFFLTKKLAKIFSQNIQKANYKKISIATIIFLIIIITLVSGWLGFLIFMISTFTGIYCISLGVRRTNMMGCLLLPVILFYLF